jgi:ribosomal-protein-alanine N-acetyltransferase
VTPAGRRRPAVPRVRLRPPVGSDRDAYLAAMLASRRFHHPWVSPATTPAGFERLVARVRDDRQSPQLVCRCEDDAIVGWFNVSEIIRGPLSSAFLGYGAVAEHAGRGYMSEGLQLLLRHAFDELGLHRLEANIQPANETSIALVRRAGFVREGLSVRYLKIRGRWRDHERWAIRSEQWRDQRRA